jgi:hypothetical protein
MLAHSAQKLYGWLRKQDFRGHDPHDLLESPLIPAALKQSSFLRLAILQVGRRSPIDLHRALRVEPAFNPKGGALIMQALLRAKERVSPAWQADVDHLRRRLLDSAVRTQSGHGWGYPFAWQSRTHYLPKNTPTIVTTAFVGDALINSYEDDHDAEVLEMLRSAGEYILKDVSRTESADGLAFGYAENDPQVVFNASLLGAAFLARLNSISPDSRYSIAANEAARFVLQHQNPDGSWWYGLEPSQKWMDSFHTGYVLLSLREISKSLEMTPLDEAIASGYDFYRHHFFIDGLPTYFPRTKYPIDTHSCAHAILTLTEFGDHDAASHIATWMRENMQSTDGYFFYQKHARYVNRVPYIRWTNAWMMLALSTLLMEGEK